MDEIKRIIRDLIESDMLPKSYLALSSNLNIGARDALNLVNEVIRDLETEEYAYLVEPCQQQMIDESVVQSVAKSSLVMGQ